MNKKILIMLVLMGFVSCLVVGYLYFYPRENGVVSPMSKKVVEKPLERYSFKRLVVREEKGSEIVVEKVMGEEEEYISYLISFMTEGKKVTGQMNVPTLGQDWPVVVMLRGYVPEESYETGVGTRNAAGYFAQSGYLTIAPDFLGYGGSDSEGDDSFAARVKRPATVLDLIASIPTLGGVDLDRIFMWGHSNGGQIGISVLEVLGKREEDVVKAASFWAPVTKPFPYSILYYTDESDDRGKEIRKVLAQFESDYDVFDYSLDMYFDWLNTPILVHQGTADDAVPKEWSGEFVSVAKELEKDVTHYVYPGADHNMWPSWNTVVRRDFQFFEMH